MDDFAALLSDASVYQFIARPTHELQGMRLLATALLYRVEGAGVLLNGFIDLTDPTLRWDRIVFR